MDTGIRAAQEWCRENDISYDFVNIMGLRLTRLPRTTDQVCEDCGHKARWQAQAIRWTRPHITATTHAQCAVHVVRWQLEAEKLGEDV
jgi:hypothetical protein